MRTYGDPVDVRVARPVLLPAADALEPDPFDAAPEQFLWRGRLYVVTAVLAHWVELGAWWVGAARASRPRAEIPAAGGPAALGPAAVDHAAVDSWRGTRAAAARAAVGEPEPVSAPAAAPAAAAARSVALDVGAIERAVWRVEARAGRARGTGVYDLVRDVPAAAAGRTPGAPGRPGRWRLARALD
ncbi:MAG: DUF6504 family protein [Candidatus Nanopelagicales bacterium]|jgi:hypothetical protein